MMMTFVHNTADAAARYAVVCLFILALMWLRAETARNAPPDETKAAVIFMKLQSMSDMQAAMAPSDGKLDKWTGNPY